MADGGTGGSGGSGGLIFGSGGAGGSGGSGTTMATGGDGGAGGNGGIFFGSGGSGGAGGTGGSGGTTTSGGDGGSGGLFGTGGVGGKGGAAGNGSDGTTTGGAGGSGGFFGTGGKGGAGGDGGSGGLIFGNGGSGGSGGATGGTGGAGGNGGDGGLFGGSGGKGGTAGTPGPVGSPPTTGGAGGAGGHGSTVWPEASPQMASTIASILRVEPSELKDASSGPGGAGAAQQEAVRALIEQANGKALTTQQVVDTLIDVAAATTSVAALSYQFFTGKLPTKAGLDYLVSSPDNPNDLNDGSYAGLNLENRFINMGVSLGKAGEGSAGFQAAYGGLSFADAATKAYTEIFGAPAPGKIAAILTTERVAYFNALGGDALGAKAALVGWFLAEAAKTDAGAYGAMNQKFLLGLFDGAAAFGMDGHTLLPASASAVELVGTAQA
jgi:hypothetical protein